MKPRIGSDVGGRAVRQLAGEFDPLDEYGLKDVRGPWSN
jgi:hypothetical protein